MSSEVKISKSDFCQKYYMRDESWLPITKPKVKELDLVSRIQDGILNRNESHDILAVGLRGTSKSSSLLALSRLVDPDFNIDNVAFTIEEQIEKSSRFSRGSVILFDDAGTEGAGSSRNSLSKENRKLSDVSQMSRTDGVPTFYTTTEDGRIDKRIRSMFTYVLTPVKKITYNHGLASVLEVHINAQIINKDPSSEFLVKSYRKKLSYGSGNITHVVVPHCPKDLMKEYSTLRKQRLDKVRRRTILTSKYNKQEE